VEEEDNTTDQTKGEELMEEGKEEDKEQTPDKIMQTETMVNDAETEMDHEMTQSEMEMEDQELQAILEKENLDLEDFLIQGTKEGIDSLPQEEFNKFQQLYLWKTQNIGPERQRSKEKQSNEGVKMVRPIHVLAPRNPGKRRGRKNQNELLMECGKLMIDSGKMKDLTSYSFTNL